MAGNSQHLLNAAEVADAVFSSIILRGELQRGIGTHVPAPLHTLIESIDAGLRTAGLSFAEYLERLRHLQQIDLRETDRRWRFSARERAVQRVDSAVAQLCTLMVRPTMDS